MASVDKVLSVVGWDTDDGFGWDFRSGFTSGWRWVGWFLRLGLRSCFGLRWGGSRLELVFRFHGRFQDNRDIGWFEVNKSRLDKFGI